MHDEVWDYAMDGGAVVLSGGAEGHEVGRGFRNRFAEYLHLDVTESSMELCNCYLLLWLLCLK